jgi:hypothetical protein
MSNRRTQTIATLLTALLLAPLSSVVCGEVIPVTDANVRSGLSPYNWIVRDDALVSSVCGASLTVGFKGTKQIAVMVDSPMAARKDPNRIPVLAWSVNGGEFKTHQCGLDEKSVVLTAGEQDPLIHLSKTAWRVSSIWGSSRLPLATGCIPRPPDIRRSTRRR